MTGASRRLRVTQVSAYLDPQGRPPDELIHAWRDFGAPAAAAARAGVRMTVVRASWADAVHTVGESPVISSAGRASGRRSPPRGPT